MVRSIKVKPILIGALAALLALPLVINAIPAGAIGEGQIEGGDIYRVRNVTQGTDFTDPVGAEPCEVLQYKVRIHNPGPGVIKEVNVAVDLPSSASTTNVSTVTITAENAQPSSTSDTATVNLSTAQSITYISGSTQLLNENSGVISSLPDGITAGGVNIGEVGISIEKLRFVQFKAEVDCPEKPPEKPEKPEKPPEEKPEQPEEQPPAVTPTKPQSPTPGQPTVTTLPAAGPADITGIVFSVMIASSAAYYVVARRLSLLA